MTDSKARGQSLVVFLILLVHGALIAGAVWTLDPIAQAPFPGGDGHDWIANGLALAGHDVHASGRPPLVPLAIAILERVGGLAFYPLLVQVLVAVTFFCLFLALGRDHPPLLAAGVSLAWALNGTWVRLSVEWMADVPAACLFALAALAWRPRAPDESPRYLLAGLLAGLSAAAQPLALLAGGPVLVAVLAFHRHDLRSAAPWIGAALFLAPTAAWALAQAAFLDTAGGGRHWTLLRPHLSSLGHYLFAGLGFVGLPAAIAILCGLVLWARQAAALPARWATDADRWRALVVAIELAVLVFFVLLYDWNSLRFLAYLFPLTAVHAADALARLRPTGASVALLATVAWALAGPGAAARGDRLTLWPLPSLEAVVPTIHLGGGNGVFHLGGMRLESGPSRVAHVEIARARHHASEVAELPPETFAEDHWALYLYSRPADSGRRYEVAGRLGNLLRKRVRYLPARPFQPLLHAFDLEPLGELDRAVLFRARLRDGQPEPGTWILAVPAGSKMALRLRQGQRGALRKLDLARARRLMDHAADHRRAAIFADRPLTSWQLALPLVSPQVELFVVEGERAAGSRRQLGQALAVERDVEPGRPTVEVRLHQVFGGAWTVFEAAQATSR